MTVTIDPLAYLANKRIAWFIFSFKLL